MTVYVDEPREYECGIPDGGLRWGTWARLTADSESEIHLFAALNLGFDKGWFHNTSRHGFYPVTSHGRYLAIRAGARALTVPEFDGLMATWRDHAIVAGMEWQFDRRYHS